VLAGGTSSQPPVRRRTIPSSSPVPGPRCCQPGGTGELGLVGAGQMVGTTHQGGEGQSPQTRGWVGPVLAPPRCPASTPTCCATVPGWVVWLTSTAAREKRQKHECEYVGPGTEGRE